MPRFTDAAPGKSRRLPHRSFWLSPYVIFWFACWLLDPHNIINNPIVRSREPLMSVIETALSKLKSGGARSSAEARAQQRRVKVSDHAAATHQPTRQFLPATIDTIAMEHNRVLPQVADQAALRAYKILRTRLLQRLSANHWKSVAVTGTESGEGKTLTAINLSIALAQDPNTRVCLVDLDLQRPQVAAQMGLGFEFGLGEYLLGSCEAQQIIYESGIPRLVVIPNSKMFEHSSEMLAGARTLELLRVIEAEMPHHIVIFDMPPLLLADDVLTFAPQVDGVLLVVAEGMTQRAMVEKAREILADMNLVGVVLNRSSERESSAYY
jgi:capsular exopolysaccharide synthesis family protein